MAFLRDDLQRWWTQWKEPSMLAIAGVMSLYFAFTSVTWAYMIIFLGLAALLFLVGVGSYRTARLRPDGIAMGHVVVDERRVTYFLGGEGFSVSVNNLVEVGLDAQSHPSKGTELFWVLKDRAGSHIRIPTAAPGAEAMFEDLSVLEGLSYADAAQMIRGREAKYQILWSTQS